MNIDCQATSGAEQAVIVVEVVFEVRVLDHHDVAGRERKSFAYRVALASRRMLQHDAYAVAPS